MKSVVPTQQGRPLAVAAPAALAASGVHRDNPTQGARVRQPVDSSPALFVPSKAVSSHCRFARILTAAIVPFVSAMPRHRQVVARVDVQRGVDCAINEEKGKNPSGSPAREAIRAESARRPSSPEGGCLPVTFSAIAGGVRRLRHRVRRVRDHRWTS